MGSSVQRLWFPSQPWGLEEAHTILSEWGSTLSQSSPVLSWNWMSSLENWKKSQHCSFFRSSVLDICISRIGKLTLKAAGVYAHWTGSGAKGEQLRRRGGEGSEGRGLPVMAIPLGPKAEFESSPLTLKKGGVRSADQVGSF